MYPFVSPVCHVTPIQAFTMEFFLCVESILFVVCMDFILNGLLLPFLSLKSQACMFKIHKKKTTNFNTQIKHQKRITVMKY